MVVTSCHYSTFNRTLVICHCRFEFVWDFEFRIWGFPAPRGLPVFQLRDGHVAPMVAGLSLLECRNRPGRGDPVFQNRHRSLLQGVFAILPVAPRQVQAN